MKRLHTIHQVIAHCLDDVYIGKPGEREDGGVSQEAMYSLEEERDTLLAAIRLLLRRLPRWRKCNSIDVAVDGLSIRLSRLQRQIEERRDEYRRLLPTVTLHA